MSSMNVLHDPMMITMKGTADYFLMSTAYILLLLVMMFMYNAHQVVGCLCCKDRILLVDSHVQQSLGFRRGLYMLESKVPHGAPFWHHNRPRMPLKAYLVRMKTGLQRQVKSISATLNA